jgi:hypothetical protein
VNNADTVVNLAPGSGPFRVLAPDTSTPLTVGSTIPIVWAVAGTVLPPISTANVDILLSTDGGETFPTVLAGSTANDGVEMVPIPSVSTTEARIMVRAVGNIFFDVSNEDMTIRQPQQADLAIVSYEAQSPPSALPIGQTATVTLNEVITNHGPFAPMDARLDGTASAQSGASVAPTSTSSVESEVGLNEQRTSEEEYTLSCDAPGPHTFTFESVISPASEGDTDPNGANDTAEESFTVECVVPVTINIKPGNAANQLNLKSGGSVPVAVLSTLPGEYGNPMAFNATTIDAASLRFGSQAAVTAGAGAPEEHGQIHPEDSFEMDERTRDGDLDAILHFAGRRSGLTGTETKACVAGTYGPADTPFIGCDTVRFSK